MYRDYISSDEPYMYRDYISSDEPYINISPCTEIILVLVSLRLIYLYRDYISSDEP